MKNFFLSLLLILSFPLIALSQDVQNPPASKTEINDEDGIPLEQYLETCTLKSFEMKFPCRLDWRAKMDPGRLFMVISPDPNVTVTILKRSDINFLSEINRQTLAEIGQYADGFQTEQEIIGKATFLKVKAFSKLKPDMRLLDYYMIHNGKLHVLMFSVDPSANWDDYKFLFKYMVDHLEFIS